jgi:RNA polymerase sigma-70 factor (ECF subfamily)
MDSLPPAQRRVLELAYFWGMTRQEIADDMEIPLGTVHTRARLGLQKLREALHVVDRIRADSQANPAASAGSD